MPPPLRPSDGAAAEDTGNDDNDVDSMVVDPAAGGTFLSLQSPTPSTSRHSQSLPPTSHGNVVVDLDSQLLDSISPGHAVAQPFSAAEYSALLAEVRLYKAREVDQVRLRTAHFCFWVFTLVACGIAVWFVPTHSGKLSPAQNHGVNFVLVLLSSLGLVAGCIDGLMALLFFRGSEKRALNEFEWEVVNAKRVALGEAGAAVEQLHIGKHN